MSKLSTELEQAFETVALRPTAQRYAVLEFLARHSVHATAEEIFLAVNRKDPRASRATVYNNLRSLEKAGLVREVSSQGKAARYDANLHRHHHFICEQCGKVEDISWFDLPVSAAGAVLAGRDVSNYEIVFRGACLGCLKTGAATAGSRPDNKSGGLL
ncbi:MAG: Fur family transcriptional regulator [Candidatus Solibacter sp.]